MSVTFLFPGQGSQSVGMLGDFLSTEPFPASAKAALQDTFAAASDAINLDLWTIAQSGPEDDLGRTENTQPVLLAAGVALFRAWQAAGGAPVALMAGHSLGEYSALVCAGAISLTDATRLVRLRGQLMQAAMPLGFGAMAAVLNADLALIEQACQDAAEGEVIAPANLNAPGQIVISGHASALERTLKLLMERGVRKVVRLPVSVPSHCELMRGAAEKLHAALAEIEIVTPKIPVVHNYSAATESSADGIRAALSAQLYSRVRWIESVQTLRGMGASRALECGPGRALSGMVKRIDADLPCATLATATDFIASLSS
jgi:[acyl-carrier-protein] S-malonyltransferase